MKALRIIAVFVLAVSLLLGSMGTIFAKGPPDVPPGKALKFHGPKHGFSGNVTNVDVTDGNVTISTGQGLTVNVMLIEEARYKIPREMNKWGNLTQFESQIGGDLSALEGRRVVALAGNVEGTWEALKFMLLPVPGLPPLHAHRTGNVTEFNLPGEQNGNSGNITIEDVHGVSHTFDLAVDTRYRPQEISELIGSDLYNAVIGHFVTVVLKGNPKLEPTVAKAIVVHRR
jgi:hypothetical protein